MNALNPPTAISWTLEGKERIRLDSDGNIFFFDITMTDAASLFIEALENMTGQKVRIK